MIVMRCFAMAVVAVFLSACTPEIEMDVYVADILEVEASGEPITIQGEAAVGVQLTVDDCNKYGREFESALSLAEGLTFKGCTKAPGSFDTAMRFSFPVKIVRLDEGHILSEKSIVSLGIERFDAPHHPSTAVPGASRIFGNVGLNLQRAKALISSKNPMANPDLGGTRFTLNIVNDGREAVKVRARSAFVNGRPVGPVEGATVELKRRDRITVRPSDTSAAIIAHGGTTEIAMILRD